MKISVIIPVSRVEETKDCLLAFDKQDFPKSDFELVLVSVKDLSMLEGLSLSYRVSFMKTEDNHPSRMRNLGVENSSGEILGFVDDDTVIPPNWMTDVCRILSEEPGRIIGGPNLDRRRDFKFALANAIQEHPMLEGLNNHRSMERESMEVSARDLPLSNAAMTREVFLSIGGFNEVANYYMDGSEFLYIASRMNIPIHLYRNLEIQHNNRPAFLPYFKYKWRSRYMLGGNYVLFPECYQGAKQIRFIFLSLLVLPFLVLSLVLNPALYVYFLWGAAGYVGLLYLTSLRFLNRPGIFLFLGPSVLVAQAASYCGFVYGWVERLLTRGDCQHVVDFKKSRYKAIESSSV